MNLHSSTHMRYAGLCHPVTVVSLFVLPLNDRTRAGKLSHVDGSARRQTATILTDAALYAREIHGDGR
ncbi:hypothetical protein GCM10012278_11310 [Nonomuraea glycinis]|uniref:Uncharacterized protein n=1 Tax=Nonomuraea glycinis TaxID=2047744 RepID=A0A918A092_9ACTN|nr:hypothetical protein GCM10012278_11310 [Nonomuraea glycinis]